MPHKDKNMELRAVGKEASHGSSHLKKENNEKKPDKYWDCGDRYRRPMVVVIMHDHRQTG